MNKRYISLAISLSIAVIAPLIGADSSNNYHLLAVAHEAWPWPAQFIPSTENHFKDVTKLMFGDTPPPFSIAHVEQVKPEEHIVPADDFRPLHCSALERMRIQIQTLVNTASACTEQGGARIAHAEALL